MSRHRDDLTPRPIGGWFHHARHRIGKSPAATTVAEVTEELDRQWWEVHNNNWEFSRDGKYLRCPGAVLVLKDPIDPQVSATVTIELPEGVTNIPVLQTEESLSRAAQHEMQSMYMETQG